MISALPAVESRVMGESRCLLHVTQADRWPAVISNLRNLADQGLSPRVRVMINGTAIYAVQGVNDWTEAMRESTRDGAVFEICSRSVANHGLPRETLPPWLTLVDAAIPAIAECIAEGWTYIKP